VEYALAAILGLCLGSFLNVLIYRLPRRESVAWPASHCPHCGKPIAPWDNVPLLSFLLLEARCRACRAPIAWRYPLVEGLSSGAALALVAWLGVSLAALGALYFTLCLLAVAWIDHDHRIVPDTLSGALLAGGLLVRGADPLGLATALLGALLGSGGLYAVAWGYRRVRGVEGLGGGDVKLAAGLGAFLGPPGVLLTVLLSAALGSLVGLWLLATRRGSGRTALPFATFLAPAALTVLAAGPALWRGYLELARVAAGP
jgi:leader peptidase (prepilin peptidase)/N-methyltransferase